LEFVHLSKETIPPKETSEVDEKLHPVSWYRPACRTGSIFYAGPMLVPMANNQALRKQLKTIPAEAFTRRWAGFATMKQEYRMKRSQGGPFHQYVQRSGERMKDWRYKAFLSTADADEVEALTLEFPKRWHIEEFFNLDQALGWKRAGTMNLEIRYGQMTMALLAQAAIHQLRMRLGNRSTGGTPITWPRTYFRAWTETSV